jgi:hypothetical protein
MSDKKYCEIIFEGNKNDIEKLMKDKEWEFELYDYDEKVLYCKIKDENYEELEFFKGLATDDELETTKILDIVEIEQDKFEKEVKAIKEKEEREKDEKEKETKKEEINDENDEKEKNKNNDENEKEKSTNEKIQKIEDDEKERDNGVGMEEENEKENINTDIPKNDYNLNKNENIIKNEKERTEKKENKTKLVNDNLNEEEKKLEKFDFTNVLLPLKEKLKEDDIINTLLSKDFLIKFFIISSGLITFFCLFDN